MKKKIIIAVCVVIVLIIGIVPIVTKGNNKENGGKGNNKFTVYVVDNDTIQRSLISKFEQKYPDVKVQEIVFNDYSSLYERLNKDLIAGKGPDIIWASMGAMSRINKLVGSGVFLDLNELVKNDKEFKLEDYNEAVLNAGVYDNKRYFIPFDYYTSSICTTKKMLNDSGIDISNILTYKDLIEVMSNYVDKHPKDKNKCLMNNDICFTIFAKDMGYELIDYNNKTVNCSSKEFRELVDTYKKLYKYDNYSDLIEEYNGDTVKMIKDNKTLFFDTDSVLNYSYYVEGELRNNQDEIEYLGRLGSAAYVNKFMAINSNSKFKKEAFNFIKLGLDMSFQSNEGTSYGALLINKEAFKYNIDQAANSFAYLKTDNTEAMKEKYIKEVNDIDDCSVFDTNIESIFNDEFDGYLNDESSFDKCVKSFKDKVELYLKE